MNIYHDLDAIKDLESDNVAITIGNFDGVHRGHKYLLSNFKKYCDQRNLRAVVLSFNPHPVQIIKNVDRYLIEDPQEMIGHISQIGINDIFLFPFTEKIQKMNGKDFINYLTEYLPSIKAFYLGHDFSLGANKEFDFKQLYNLFSSTMECVQEKEYVYEKNKPSSSKIRKLITHKGDVENSAKLLARPYSLKGKVIKGNQIGKSLGFPTANLKIHESVLIPKNGVYFARAKVRSCYYSSLVNIGKRPTVTKDKDPTIEVYLLNFNENIYDEELKIEFINYIREEKKFNSTEELVKQINKDKNSIVNKEYQVKMALIGKNIAHSRSYEVYSDLLNGFPIDYSVLDYEDESIIPALNKIVEKYEHVSVTSPYKKFCLTQADKKDSQIPETINGTNCLGLINKKVYATNTDYMACKVLLDKYRAKYSIEYFCLLGQGAMADVFNQIFSEKKLLFKQFTRSNMSELNDYLQLNTKILIINACSRNFIFTDPKSSDFIFWDLNYSMPEHLSLFYRIKVEYIDGIELLYEQAKYALSFWNLNSD